MNIGSLKNQLGLKRISKTLLNVAIVAYVAAVAYYLLFGPARFHLLGVKIVLEDLFNPLLILVVVVGLRLLLAITWNKKRVFDVIILSISTVVALGSIEAFYRIKYPDDMNPPRFTFNDAGKTQNNDRGPYSDGPKAPGVQRIMVQGDSITFGMGVPDYKDLYPYKLLKILNKDSEKYDMQVWALPGMQVDYHAENLNNVGEEVDPDIIVYQWFMNDTEIMLGRPKPIKAPWQKNPVHYYLERWSILYRLVDGKLYTLAYQQGAEYAQYLNTNMVPYKKGWWLFAREFHKWATFANGLAGRSIVLVYPSLPFHGEYPFAKVTDAMISLAKPHEMKIPAAYLPKRDGLDEPGLGSTYELARVARVGKTIAGHLTFGPYINFGRGQHQAGFNLKLLSPAPEGARVALLEVVTDVGQTIMSSRTIYARDMEQVGQWKKFTLPFTVERRMLNEVEFRVEWFGEADLALDTIDVPVDYKLEIVNPVEKLKTFNTHARLFDAHPGPRAHTVLAEALAEQITNKR
ncbi:MAG: hypothetical protein OEY50_04845 [Nitrospinota bacterium]|nr:hypothetical protein [Nitrospinota bacterium]